MKTCKDCLHNEMCYATHTDDSPTCCDFTDRSEWVHLPCRAGDSIFCDGELFSDRYAGEVKEFTVDVVRTQVCTTHRGEIDMIFNFKDFGKTVFLTREEAEKALERKKENEKRNDKH